MPGAPGIPGPPEYRGLSGGLPIILGEREMLGSVCVCVFLCVGCVFLCVCFSVCVFVCVCVCVKDATIPTLLFLEIVGVWASRVASLVVGGRGQRKREKRNARREQQRICITRKAARSRIFRREGCDGRSPPPNFTYLNLF